MRSVPILIVGGGAAGMMAAAAVSGCGKKALIIEKMNQLGKKILATGMADAIILILDKSLNFIMWMKQMVFGRY